MANNISFFMPVYNCEKYIEEAVESIMKTNFADGDELVICDDCSTDNTPAVLNKLVNKYPVIHVIRHSINRGGGMARNTAIMNTSNNLLFCLDSDNVLAENSILPLKEFLLNENADIAAFERINFFRKEQPKENIDHIWKYPYMEYTPKNVLSTIYFPGASGNYLFTKKSWMKVGGYLPSGLDTWSFGFRQVMEGFRMVILKDSCYFHRFGISNSYWMTLTRETAPSIMALADVIPYLNRIKKSDVKYMFGRGKKRWYDELDKRPIRIEINR